VLTDLDAAVTLAEKRGLKLALVLFNHVPQMPRSWIEQSAARSALLAALGPLFARYKGRAGIYEIAEPTPQVATDKALRELGWNPYFRLSSGTK